MMSARQPSERARFHGPALCCAGDGFVDCPNNHRPSIAQIRDLERSGSGAH